MKRVGFSCKVLFKERLLLDVNKMLTIFSNKEMDKKLQNKKKEKCINVR